VVEIGGLIFMIGLFIIAIIVFIIFKKVLTNEFEREMSLLWKAEEILPEEGGKDSKRISEEGGS